MASLASFGQTAKGLARNPLGIIALFIVLIYGFASLVVGVSGHLGPEERQPIIWFLVVFPCLVLGVFAWLVSQHHTKLYAPSDYQEDESFIQASQATYRAAISLGAATAKLEAGGTPREEIEEITASAAARLARSARVGSRTRRTAKTVLWVDDHPDNNTYERQALEQYGIRFVLATSTEEASELVRSQRFDAVISDMNRPPDRRAGYTLLDGLRRGGNPIPFIIYAGPSAPKHAAEAHEHGALGSINRPDELFSMVLDAVGLGTSAA
jgi:CheY-like chemotaxis protein